jgi:hypothetical protein
MRELGLGLAGRKVAPISKHQLVEDLSGVERGHAVRCFQVFAGSGLEGYSHFALALILLVRTEELLGY